MHDTSIYIGLNIRRLREEKKMNIQALADTLKRRRETVSSWENGRNVPPKPTLAKLAAFFSVDVEDLYKKPETKDAVNEALEYKEVAKVPFVTEYNKQAYIANYDNINFIKKIPSYHFIDTDKRKKVKGFEVTDSAMAPKIEAQDVLLCEEVKEELWKYLSGNAVVVLTEGIFIRKIEWHEDSIKLKPINPLFEEKNFKKSEILELYKIFQLHRRLKN